MDEKELRKLIWQKTMLLTIEMGYKKTQFLKGKYAAFKEIWEELGGDMSPTVRMDENASGESKKAISKMIEVASETYGKII